MGRFLKGIVAVVAITAVVVWFVAMAKIGMDHQDEWYGNMDRPAVEQGMPECIDDSAPNAPCYWDAKENGDGEGTSFTVDAFGNTHYWEDA